MKGGEKEGEVRRKETSRPTDTHPEPDHILYFRMSLLHPGQSSLPATCSPKSPVKNGQDGN